MGTSIVSTGEEGFLLHGPYTKLSIGSYAFTVHGISECEGIGCRIEVVHSGGTQVLCPQEMLVEPGTPWAICVPFELSQSAVDVEVRVWLPNGLPRLEISHILFEKTITLPTKRKKIRSRRK